MYRALGDAASGDQEYRGLLGDCFLIRLARGAAKSHILIDCGMLLGSPAAKARMGAVAEDIRHVCGGRLDLLVITHEHWDHLSGFDQAADIFFDPKKLAIDQIWMAWTEDPDDPVAKGLRARFDKTGVALAGIAARLRDESARFGADAVRQKMGGLDGFMGAAAATGADGKRAAHLTTRGILDRLKQLRPGGKHVRYLKPGEVVPRTPGAVSLPVHVLGPPRDLQRLFKDKPSAKTPETYLDAPTVDGARLMRFAEGEDPDPSRDSPFAPDYCRFTIGDMEAKLASAAPADAASCEFLREHYHGMAGTDGWRLAAMERRRIDTDWLGAAGAMALKMDSDTNNTSLALALELPGPAGDVMLFPGDAQVGNWESWRDQPYQDEHGAALTAEQLLNRTRLYKVGHHGSHNATLAAHGLEMMTHPGLFALIPTDEDLGKRQGKGWLMPNPRVKAALRDQTGGRILRNDRRYPSRKRSAAENAKLRKDPDVRDVPDEFLAIVNETDLYLEVTLL